MKKITVSPSIQKNPILTLLFRLWRHLSQRRQFQFWLLLGLMIVSTFVEMISLGAVLPFLGILLVPDKVFSHPIVHSWAPGFGISSAGELVLPLTIAFGAAALLAGTFRILLLWVSTRMAFAMGADLSIEVYRRTLFQPYRVHMARNSSQIISSITNKVNGVVFEVLLPLLVLISSLVLSVGIMVALLFIDPLVASAAIIIFGFSYGLITWFTRQSLYMNSQSIAREQTQVVKALQEGLGGIRDVLLEGAQSVYCDVYKNADRPLRWAQGNNAFVVNYPRYALEALGMILITVLSYILSLEAGGLADSVPVLGALAIGAQRVLPALQQSYGNWTRIAGTHVSLDDTLELLDQPVSEESLQLDPVPMDFKSSIQYKGVSFRYTYEGPLVLDNFNLSISKGARVGFVGRTGSGKSTALDLMMGLLLPTEGGIFVDDQPIGGQRVRAWQRTIAHVPQSIYLSDNTLAENIAFGVPLVDIDIDRVRQAAQQAQISDFIESGSEGYKAKVGERGIRLSAGQRQRIGIARALYKKASVLVFDEATSALDNATEKEVMSSIEGLKRDLTILIIAHRITTVRHCDVIVELDRGRVVAQGTFEQLIQSSPSFRGLAKAMEVEKNDKRL